MLRNYYRCLLLTLLISLLAVPATRAQSLSDNLNEVGNEYAAGYVQPLVDAFGADINSGLFHSAKVGGGLLPLVDVYIGAKAFGALVPSSDEQFVLTLQEGETFTLPGSQRYQIPETQTLDAPTVFGSDDPDDVTLDVIQPGPDREFGTGDDERTSTTVTPLQGLVNTPIAPLVAPQIGLGSSLLGTDLTIRYVPQTDILDYGAVNLFGIGVRHSLSQYIPLSPVSVSAQVMWQSLGIEDNAGNDIVSASALAGNVAVSKSLLLLTVYGGLQLERTSVDVEYVLEAENLDERETIAFDLSGRNNVRALAGVSLNLGLFTVNVDYSLGSVQVVSAGAGVSL